MRRGEQPVRRPGPDDRRARLTIWGAPALLLAVALVHAVLVLTTDLTPWRVGGFGMFSTSVDSEARFVRVTVVSPERTERVPLPVDLAESEDRLRAQPTRRRAEGLARRLLARATEPTPDWPPHDPAAGDRPSVTAVQVEVWERTFRSGPPRLSTRRLFVEVAGHGG